MGNTTIGTREVPVREGPKSIVSFWGGARGAREAGRYAFWTGVYRVEGEREFGYTVRSLEHLPPGERFDRHPENHGYNEMRTALEACLYVRAASVREVESWLKGHRRDAAFATEARIGDDRYRVTSDCRLAPGK